ncbi:hypothetical protein MAPG_04548 [Magnaporthiopsis poae ATCC 64411]|uniref:Protein kinase domain-containing protein n=1 Tax=Magnaporthiopsis poae (strain ATCC 64411 / 73-15) TaxID=644358 RepID=A0A0C4DX12_MAGP6|nr:hypothetical protein MAPG_04548 [Magnaporthiopsis poae ATCC 64411]
MSDLDETLNYAILFNDVDRDTLFVDNQASVWPYSVQKVMGVDARTGKCQVLFRFTTLSSPEAIEAHSAGRKLAHALYRYGMTVEQKDEILERGRGQPPGDFASLEGRVPNLQWSLTPFRDSLEPFYLPYHNMGTLHTLIANCRALGARLPREIVLRFVVEMVEALDAVYSSYAVADVIHGVVKAQNILVHQHNGSNGARISFYLGSFNGENTGTAEASASQHLGVEAANYYPRDWDVPNLVQLTAELLALPGPASGPERALRELQDSLTTAELNSSTESLSDTLSYIISRLSLLYADFLRPEDAATLGDFQLPCLDFLVRIGRRELQLAKEKGGSEDWRLYNFGPGLLQDGTLDIAPKVFSSVAAARAASEGMGDQASILVIDETEQGEGV